MCDLDREEFAQMTACRAGMNGCWQRIVEEDSPGAIEPVSVQAIEETLDNLDLRWQLVFSSRSCASVRWKA